MYLVFRLDASSLFSSQISFLFYKRDLEDRKYEILIKKAAKSPPKAKLNCTNTRFKNAPKRIIGGMGFRR